MTNSAQQVHDNLSITGADSEGPCFEEFSSSPFKGTSSAQFMKAMHWLIEAELNDGPSFTESEVFTLLEGAQGTIAESNHFGRLLSDDHSADVSSELAHKLASLSISQDWAIRTLLALHEVRRRDDVDVSARDIGLRISD
jgi:hypothetical protein